MLLILIIPKAHIHPTLPPTFSHITSFHDLGFKLNNWPQLHTEKSWCNVSIRAIVCVRVRCSCQCAVHKLFINLTRQIKSHQEGSDSREPLLALHGRPTHVTEKEVERSNRKDPLLRFTQQFANTVSNVKGHWSLVDREIRTMHTQWR